MNINDNDMSAMGNNQQGAVLIVVLLFLVLITLAGVMSVKHSNTDLRVATSDQVNTVLLQSADNANSKLEQAVNSPSTSNNYKDMFIQHTGIMYHYLYDTNTADDRISFCFRPRQKNFSKVSAEIKRHDTTFLANDSGYCDPSVPDDYTGIKATTMTQVTMSKYKPNEDDIVMFGDEAQGTDAASNTIGKIQFDFYSTSILPTLGSASVGDVNTCVKKSDELDVDDVDDDGNLTEINNKAILTCMKNADIVAKQIVERVEITDIALTDFCKKHGGAAGSSKSTLCNGTAAAAGGGTATGGSD